VHFYRLRHGVSEDAIPEAHPLAALPFIELVLPEESRVQQPVIIQITPGGNIGVLVIPEGHMESCLGIFNWQKGVALGVSPLLLTSDCLHVYHY
jgi:hypothetical protein